MNTTSLRKIYLIVPMLHIINSLIVKIQIKVYINFYLILEIINISIITTISICIYFINWV